MVSVDDRRAPAGGPVKPPPKRIARRTRPGSKGKPRFKVSGVPDEAKRAWIRSKACCVSGARLGESVLWPWTIWGQQRPAVIVAAHAKARGAGGTDAELVPLERALHEEQHRIGARSFERKYAYHLRGETLREVAAAYDAAWRAAQAGAGP